MDTAGNVSAPERPTNSPDPQVVARAKGASLDFAPMTAEQRFWLCRLLSVAQLTPTTRLVAAALAAISHTNEEGQPTVHDVAEAVGLPLRVVTDALDELIEREDVFVCDCGPADSHQVVVHAVQPDFAEFDEQYAAERASAHAHPPSDSVTTRVSGPV